MAQNAGTFDTTEMIGIREDLSDVISNVSPETVPFQSNIGSKRIRSTYHEWQIDALAAPDGDNAVQEGAQYSYSDPTPTTRVGNYAQIMRKTAQTSRTADAVNTAGRAREHLMQVVKRGRELRRDKEKILLSNRASSNGSGASTATRYLGGFPAWLETNARRAAGGADGGFSASSKTVVAATDSTTAQRTFTETLMKDMLQDVFTNSDSSPSTLYMSPFQKRTFSGFAGIADLRHPVNGNGQATIIGAAERYVSDWGTLTTVVNRWMRSREVFAVNHDYVRVGVLRPLTQRQPAEDSDATKTVMIEECTLIVDNEAAHGVLADLTTA